MGDPFPFGGALPVIAVMLALIAIILLFGHGVTDVHAALEGTIQTAAGVVAGLVIGVVAAVLGVAGGEQIHCGRCNRHQKLDLGQTRWPLADDLSPRNQDPIALHVEPQL